MTLGLLRGSSKVVFQVESELSLCIIQKYKFSKCRLTSDTVLTSSISVPGLHKLRAERETVRQFSAWEEEIFNILTQWATGGCPDDALSYPPPVEGRHTLPGTDLQLALDAIAKFIHKGMTVERKQM